LFVSCIYYVELTVDIYYIGLIVKFASPPSTISALAEFLLHFACYISNF